MLPRTTAALRLRPQSLARFIGDLLNAAANSSCLIARISRASVRASLPAITECFRSIHKQQPHIPGDALERTRRLMSEAVPDCLVTGYEGLVEGLDLPDPDDRHVLAAAIRGGAQAIVTYDLRDFPDHVLERYDVESKHPPSLP